jgi:hypothetical protein
MVMSVAGNHSDVHCIRCGKSGLTALNVEPGPTMDSTKKREKHAGLGVIPLLLGDAVQPGLPEPMFDAAHI